MMITDATSSLCHGGNALHPHTTQQGGNHSTAVILTCQPVAWQALRKQCATDCGSLRHGLQQAALQLSTELVI